MERLLKSSSSRFARRFSSVVAAPVAEVLAAELLREDVEGRPPLQGPQPLPLSVRETESPR